MCVYWELLKTRKNRSSRTSIEDGCTRSASHGSSLRRSASTSARISRSLNSMGGRLPNLSTHTVPTPCSPRIHLGISHRALTAYLLIVESRWAVCHEQIPNHCRDRRDRRLLLDGLGRCRRRPYRLP